MIRSSSVIMFINEVLKYRKNNNFSGAGEIGKFLKIFTNFPNFQLVHGTLYLKSQPFFLKNWKILKNFHKFFEFSTRS
jgi:hypothetical protein